MRYANFVPARVDVEEYIEAIKLKDPYIRTVQGQISWWAKIGRHALANPELKASEVEKLVIETARRKQEGYKEC